MKILFITRLYYPHIGGVEKHVKEISKVLERKGHIVTVVSEHNIKSPHIKLFGLIFIWVWLFKNRKLIEKTDIVHCHDVFIWYLPFRFLYPKKPVFTTIHGLEWDNPLNKLSIWQKRLIAKLSTGVIGVGKFLEKYLKIKFDLITYGAVTMIHINIVKKNNTFVYVGRLEKNTGLLKFLEWLKNYHYIADFCGDGDLRKECEKYGTVHGFTDPTPYLRKAEFCVPGGYLAALEGLSYGCKLKLFWNNNVKADYWKMSPFLRKDVKAWAKSQTWNKLADEYLYLYNHIK
jgi:glycosyltransferase involved in cell wall biosynthesis